MMQKLQVTVTAGVKSQADQPEPRDAFRVAYSIHFVLGAGNLLPWNAVITAVDYFGHLYPSRHVEKVFAVAYMGSSLLVLGIMARWGGWMRKKMSFRLRMNLGFCVFVFSLMAILVLDWAGYGGFYGATVAAVVGCGLADGMIGGSLVGSAGKLPKEYMQAVFAGTASSGVLVCILRIITKASVPHTPQGLRASSHLYFTVTIAILLGCIVCCNLLYKLPVMQHHYIILRDNHLPLPPSSPPEFRDVARKIRWPALGVFVIYAVTLSIFPGFIAENLKSRILQDWYPVVLITTYNVSDLVGKCLTATYVVNGVGKATWACIARLLFYPLFTLCLHGPDWLKTEAPMLFLTIALGLTNGYLTSVIMILTPKSVTISEAEVSAIVMVVFLGMGLAAGSVLGWFWII